MEEGASAPLVAAALCHSRDGERVPYVGLRAQKTDSTEVEEEGGPRSVRRPTGTEATSSGGSGRHLCLRWPGRRRVTAPVAHLGAFSRTGITSVCGSVV